MIGAYLNRMRKIVIKQNQRKLPTKLQHILHPIYYNFELGGGPHGIHGALPLEVLLVFHLGMLKYLLGSVYEFAVVLQAILDWYKVQYTWI